MTAPFKTARAIPFSSVVGGGIMLLNDGGACVAQLAIMAGSKETSDAISEELLRRIRSAPQPSEYQYSDPVIEAARELRNALMEDGPFGNSAMGADWFLREHPAIAAISEQPTEAEESDQ